MATTAEVLDQRVMLSGTTAELQGAVDGQQWYAIPAVDPSLIGEENLGNDPIGNGPFPYEETFKLNSLPGATKTIYLDFNGHVTDPSTPWSNRTNPGQPIVTPAFDFDGNPTTFSNAEMDRIQNIWQRVAEDFAPFNINVTTEEPPLEDLINRGGGDDRWGIRVAIGGSSNDWFNASAGGVAYVGSFRWNTDTPTFVFTKQLGNGNEKFTAEAVSHELGHTLGLGHDGKSPSTQYYRGHGTGETGWAPIMGVGYYQDFVQWSKGEYTGANQTQDDLAIITSANNGAGYRADDYGDDLATATALTPPVSGGIQSINIDGIIGRTTDLDVFRIAVGAGTIDLTFTADGRGSNLDIAARLLDENGVEVAASNPVDGLDARITLTVPQGIYFIEIDGTGKGDPLGTGYTDYASLGQYNITGTASEFRNGKIAGIVFEDLNGNGTQDPGEAALAGQIVYFDENGNGFRDVRTTPDYAATNLGAVVLDRTSMTSTISVSGINTRIVDLNVTINLSHSFTKDLDIYLIAPDGTRVELATDVGGIGYGFINTTFDDSAATSIDADFTPFTGSYRPEGSLAALNGYDPNGIWTLEVYDDASGDRGMLNSWSLNLTAGNDEAYATTDASGYYEFDALSVGTYNVGMEKPGYWEQTYPAGGSYRVTVLGEGEQRFNDNFGIRFSGAAGAAAVPQDIFGRASNGRAVIMESNGTRFQPRYAQADGVWSGALPTGPHWNNLIVGDFNNDGLDDLAGLSSQDGKWRVLIATNDGFLAPQEWGMLSMAVTWSEVMAGDVNGDGLTDVIARASTGTWIAAVSTGTSFEIKNFGGWSTAVTWQDVQTADVNGDGRTDIIGRASTGTWVAGISNSGQFVMSVFGGWVTTVNWTTVLTGDFNGDGKTDILGRASSGTWVGGLSDGTKFVNYVFGGWSTLVGWSQIHVADFNGDGMDDLVGLSSTGRVVVGISTGMKFNMSIWTNWATTVSWTTVIGDFDGDGRADIAGRASSGSWYVALSQGNQFVTQAWGGWTTLVDWDNIRVGVFV